MMRIVVMVMMMMMMMMIYEVMMMMTTMIMTMMTMVTRITMVIYLPFPYFFIGTWYYLDCPEYYTEEDDGAGGDGSVDIMILRRGDLSMSATVSKYIDFYTSISETDDKGVTILNSFVRGPKFKSLWRPPS